MNYCWRYKYAFPENCAQTICTNREILRQSTGCLSAYSLVNLFFLCKLPVSNALRRIIYWQLYCIKHFIYDKASVLFLELRIKFF